MHIHTRAILTGELGLVKSEFLFIEMGTLKFYD